MSELYDKVVIAFQRLTGMRITPREIAGAGGDGDGDGGNGGDGELSDALDFDVLLASGKHRRATKFSLLFLEEQQRVDMAPLGMCVLCV